jgi:carboxypeptidase C (cathepsin A)
MKNGIRVRTLLLIAMFVAMAVAPSAPAQDKNDSRHDTESKAIPAAPPADSATEGYVTVGGQAIAYRAVAGTLTVGSTDVQDAMIGLDGKYLHDAGVDLPAKPEDQPATARMFYAAYFKKGAPAASRPITFLYNGGPGSATMEIKDKSS